MRKVLFLAYGGGHINSLIPIIKELYKEDSCEELEVCAIGINLAAETLRENRIACKTLSCYMDEEILEIGHPLALQFHNFNSTVSYADSIAYYGFSMKDLINNLGKDKAYKVFNIYDRRLMLPIESMKKILEKEKPDVVVVTTMHRFEAATILAAKELGIPSIKIEDLVGNVQMPFPDKIQVKDQEEYDQMISRGFLSKQLVIESDLNEPDIKAYREKVYKIYLDMQPTRICVLNSFVKDKLIKDGKVPESIIVTGQPSFDRLKQYVDIDKNYYIKKLGLNPGKPIFSFMSQPLGDREDTLRKIITGLKEMPNIQFIIKLHPNEDGKVQRMILEEMNYNAVIVKEICAPIISKISTVTSTVSSTTGLEAACLDTNLVYFNFSNKPDFVPYQDMGVGIRIERIEDIKPILESVISGTEFAKDIAHNRKEFTESLGMASKNVVEVIKEIIGE